MPSTRVLMRSSTCASRYVYRAIQALIRSTIQATAWSERTQLVSAAIPNNVRLNVSGGGQG